MSTPEALQPDAPLAPSAPMPASRPADGVPADGGPADGASVRDLTADAVPAQAVPASGARDHAVPTHDVRVRAGQVRAVEAHAVPVQATQARGVRAHDVPAPARPGHGVASAGTLEPRRVDAPSVSGRGGPAPVRRTSGAQVRDPHDLDIASLGLGLLAYVTATRFGAVSILLGLAAAVTGILALRAGRRSKAIAGLVLGLTAIPSAAVLTVL